MIPFTLWATVWLPSPAAACGGFFCNSSAPVEQTGEDIFFYVDEAAGTVSAHIEIEYQGPSEDFAWIVPVATLPEVGVGADELFTLLAANLSPLFTLQVAVEGECKSDGKGVINFAGSSFYSSDETYVTSGGVTVVDQVAVGPYDAVTLLADSTTALVDWLTEHGYDLPPAIETVLTPYVSSGQYFVALKLQKDKDTGDIVPLVLTYAGTTASIPIQLTSIAATPDMRLRVNILGSRRAVPESYLHLEINPFAVDWWNSGDNYDDVVTLAAKEAGGHGFATDFAGAPPDLSDIDSPAWDTDQLGRTTDVVDFLLLVQAQGYPAAETLLVVLREHIPLPPSLAAQGVTDVDMYNCPDCYAEELRAMPFDSLAAAADIQNMIVGPRRALATMFATGGVVTRFTSSLSPADMTVDPAFALNGEVGDVPRERLATQTIECRESRTIDDVQSRLSIGTYSDLRLPSPATLDEQGLDYHNYIMTLHEPSNERVQAMRSTGPGEDVVDNHALIEANIVAFNEAHADDTGSGCGCAHGGSIATVAWLPLLALGRRRRQG